MDIAVIGTGFIGSTLGQALSRSGHRVLSGSRQPGAGERSIADAVAGAEVVILAMPGAAVAAFAAENEAALGGKVVIDATNRMGEAVANSRAALPPTVRYARAFNTVGGENMADPDFDGVTADMFFSSAAEDRAIVERVIEGVGMRPVYLGADNEELADALFRIWIELAMKQGRGRRLAFKLLEG